MTAMMVPSRSNAGRVFTGGGPEGQPGALAKPGQAPAARNIDEAVLNGRKFSGFSTFQCFAGRKIFLPVFSERRVRRWRCSRLRDRPGASVGRRVAEILSRFLDLSMLCKQENFPPASFEAMRPSLAMRAVLERGGSVRGGARSGARPNTR